MSKPEIEQKPVSAIVQEMIKSVNATGAFLDFLSQVGDWKFRTKALSDTKMSTQELEKHVEDQITNLLLANREYYMMYNFIQRENLWARWEMFRGECHKELVKVMPEEVDDGDQ